MSLFATPITRIHDLDGELRRNLSPATGFRRLSGTAPGGIPQWRTSTVTGIGADSESETVAPTRAALQMAYRFKVIGDADHRGDAEAYWDDVDQHIIDLTDALSTRFLWAISTGGRLWTYRSVSVGNVDASAWEREHQAGGYRLVTVSFKAHPNATITPLSEV